MSVYYNDNDPKACAWLRELVKEGLIPDGQVDDRTILEIKHHELARFRQVHFFAGVGGWALALRLAGWPDDLPVWTGSCPCQPFSSAGKRRGVRDSRDLWPAFRDLVAERKPAKVFGEQVASADGRLWLSRVRTDVEGMGYALGAADLCAAGVGSPHPRQRIYWVADSENAEWGGAGSKNDRGRRSSEAGGSGARASIDGLADLLGPGLEERVRKEGVEELSTVERGRAPVRLADSDGGNRGDRQEQPSGEQRELAQDGRPSLGMGDPEGGGRGVVGDEAFAGSGGHVVRASGTGSVGLVDSVGDGEKRAGRKEHESDAASPFNFWNPYKTVLCRDGKTRRFEPRSFPLAHGIPGRLGLLRGYGNAIVPQVAAEFIVAASPEVFG